MPTLFPDLRIDARAAYRTGVLPSQTIRQLVEAGHISSSVPIGPEQIQPASIDLRLGPVAYRVRASFLPGPGTTVVKKAGELRTHELDLTRPAVLEKGCVYIVPLLEEWNLPAQFAGKANPKSTTGRLDVFTRLITDYGTEFERVPAGYRGHLYVEIVPRTFSILVQAGTTLNQLRFLRGAPTPSDAKLSELHGREPLLYQGDAVLGEPTIAQGLWICVDVQGSPGSDIIGYQAKAHAPLIEIDKLDYYDPLDFWDPIPRPKRGYLILNPEDFYILASKEKIRVPPDYAAEMVGYDPSVGEFRIHYAGFFDPGFGYGSNDIRGTRAVLEVRTHEVPFVLEDGQRVGRLIYERLLETPDRVYGPAIGSTYQRQELSLSKQFKRMPLSWEGEA
ncbi:MAG: 2'-deoxycytidine 5'-triphosphate deaminase [Chloroflexi bacterium]|nr:2'-deoxycytidine 5'-triphosphate deaminase [Chloroflexota bacterium]